MTAPQAPRSHDNGYNRGYAELCVTSNFTFLTGASHPEELVTRAAELGLAAIAITDRNSLAGVVRAWAALKELKRESTEDIHIRSSQRIDPSSRQDIGNHVMLARPAQRPLPRLIVGCRLVLRASPVDWLALPKNRAAYARLSRLLTLGKRRAEKGECHLTLSDFLEGAKGMILIALPPKKAKQTGPEQHDVMIHIRRTATHFPGHVFLGAAPRYDGRDQAYFDHCARLAHRCAAPMVAVGDVIMHHGKRRQLADVLTCMREHIMIEDIGTRALPNAERRLKGPDDMARLFRHHPAAISRSLEIAARCTFDLGELSYEYPDEISNGEAPQDRLARLTHEGLARRYPDGVTDHVRALVAKELRLVEKLGFAAYFLTVHDIVEHARSLNILCQGRGSAANSILCYALGITDVGPEVITMVFERFMSEHRGEPPDIDVDFEHERREEVIQHIYERYGRHRAGLCATVIHFRTRAAIREVGKVMGLSQDVTASLSGQIWGMSGGGVDENRVRELGLDPADRRLAQTLRLIGELIGFPRHLSQHVGGFVITKGRLDELCPIENAAMEDRTVIEWDKNDIDALGILKVDVLSLGMLTCIRKCFDLIAGHGGEQLSIATVPQDDTPTYEMLCKADAVGVFQVESRAQMNFLPRMKPRKFYDLVIEVAIVRPGPIQGGMVHPYINRRQGREKPEIPSEALRGVLGKTLGVPLFQEQAMQIAVVAAGFTAEEADRLRRSLATFRRMGTIGTFRDRFINGMLERNYTPDFAERCFSQIEGFGEYGFPESHAAAFAMLAYVSAWLKCHHPAAFACALLNAQPMGFYAPAQIVRDAREHQIEVRPICVNNSLWDNTLERRPDGALALRLGFRQIKGLREDDASWIVAARGNGYPDPEALWLRAGITPAALERLAEADAFSDMGLGRRNALWRIKAIRSQQPLPLFNDPIEGEGIDEPAVTLPAMHLGQEVVEDYVAMRLSLRAHPMELLRPSMPGLIPHGELATASLGRAVVCGLVITRQRPGTASGVVFLTLEDETGVSNVIVWPKVCAHYRRAVMGGRLLRVTGYLQREGIVVHLIAQRIEDMSHSLALLGHPNADSIGQTQPQADDAPRRTAKKPAARAYHPRDQAKKLFPSRDFH
ncbi:error-prone DNA polymerase [Pseudohalocynthiibacter aestuariivivens]|jgi:error-prone DNA polymerase|uniref:Error-prone DNA polymerase n=1 Tax=Pseudohalocynthiibacter aestuariivivens TaxID=1591409 RepID=A0ABV5JFE7_9RHOB|nr:MULTISPECIES: error-prone DNA polymerase [Pseudohalocynthiibacter]MBS9717777.1 error-prone DNA polymerase [Pseudohalocynthiibacter aestuariivivens]MCK0103073.1 error-prone DNA polymerase [Pseudohalocynthiibacter sp. F2068]